MRRGPSTDDEQHAGRRQQLLDPLELGDALSPARSADLPAIASRTRPRGPCIRAETPDATDRRCRAARAATGQADHAEDEHAQVEDVDRLLECRWPGPGRPLEPRPTTAPISQTANDQRQPRERRAGAPGRSTSRSTAFDAPVTLVASPARAVMVLQSSYCTAWPTYRRWRVRGYADARRAVRRARPCR